MMNKRIGIIGNGFVGGALFENFSKIYDVEVHDLVPEFSTMEMQELVQWADLLFVCVPTPSAEDGSCNTTIVENVVKQIYSHKKDSKVIVKSTVTPGTTDALQSRFPEMKVAFNPEFLTEKNAKEDFRDQNLIVIGTDDNEFSTELTELYADFTSKKSKSASKINICVVGRKEAELFKYLANCFLATKLTFANEVYDLCGKVGIEYDQVCQLAVLDQRLGETHWQVPGNNGRYGWGGSCFPKDTEALLKYSYDNSVTLNVLESAVRKNLQHIMK